jgi:hypothetical protein
MATDKSMSQPIGRVRQFYRDALVTVTYDLLSLAPPPTELPIEPYLPEIMKFIEELNKDKS